MKKVLGLSLLLLAGSVWADSNLYPIGPSIATTNSPTAMADPGTSYRNCLTEFDVSVSSVSVLRFLSGSTTIYAIDVSTTVGLVSAPAYIRSWPQENPLCADIDATMGFTITTPAGANTVPFKASYRGQVRGSR